MNNRNVKVGKQIDRPAVKCGFSLESYLIFVSTGRHFRSFSTFPGTKPLDVMKCTPMTALFATFLLLRNANSQDDDTLNYYSPFEPKDNTVKLIEDSGP